ncbi:hypothetical protein HanPSC8_Chr14g0640891 [Helianthus annuus]|nr:hypothetical protein HanPSC8_Chr14g0640891 [Helianthus annuus]
MVMGGRGCSGGAHLFCTNQFFFLILINRGFHPTPCKLKGALWLTWILRGTYVS